MKKAKILKIISYIVVILAVIGLGVFMGNYMFKFLEPTPSNQNKNSVSNEDDKENTVKILYKDEDNSSKSDDSDFQQNKQSASKVDAIPLKNQVVTNNNVNVVKSPEVNNKTSSETASNTLVFSPNGPRWYAYASTNGLNVRETPDKKGKFLFKVAKGTRGVVKEKKDGWTYIQWDFNKKKGWSIDDYLVQGPANIVENIVNKTSVDKIDNISSDKLTQASIEKELENNKTIIGIAKPASLNETVITYTNGKDLPKKGTIVPVNGANIREAPNTKSARLIKLPKGTTVGIKSVKKVDNYQWFEITFNNNTKTGWTREDNLKF